MEHISGILKAMTTDPNLNWRVRAAIASGLGINQPEPKPEPEPGRDAA